MTQYKVYVEEFNQKRLVATFEDEQDAREYVEFKTENHRVMCEAYGEIVHKTFVIR